MDRYQKVEKPRNESPIDANEIRITSQGRMRSYITYAMTLLQEKGSDQIVFKAMGRAINKTVTIVELIKRRIVGLHQITAVHSTDITDTWEPLEEGLQTLETTRKVSMVKITLSNKDLDKMNIGYQPPIPVDQVKVPAEPDYDGEGSPVARGRGRGRGRGRSGPRPSSGNEGSSGEFEDRGYEQSGAYARGRARGRGRSLRGHGRGGYYTGPRFDAQRDSTERYNQGAARGNGGSFGEFDGGGYGQSGAYGRGRGSGVDHSLRGHGRGRGGYYTGPRFDAKRDSIEGYNQDAPRGNGGSSVEFGDEGYEQSDAYGRGRGRGRGHGSRGRGHGQGGYYAGPRFDAQRDSTEGYYQDAPRGNEDSSGEFEHRRYEQSAAYGRGRGSGRGHSSRGRGRSWGGYYTGSQFDAQRDSNEGYNQDAHQGSSGEFEEGGYVQSAANGRDRGRGRGRSSSPWFNAERDSSNEGYNQVAPRGYKQSAAYERGQGRGIGHSSLGYGRVGYNTGPRFDSQRDNNGGGRGRWAHGRGRGP